MLHEPVLASSLWVVTNANFLQVKKIEEYLNTGIDSWGYEALTLVSQLLQSI